MFEPLGQSLQKVLQPGLVEFPARRELVQNGAKMSPERTHTSEEAFERLFRILQLLHMREETAGLDGEQEAGRCALSPPRKGFLLRQA
jgi:hypothetical protein